MFDSLHAAFHEPRTRAYGRVEGAIWLLIVLSIVLLALEPLLEGRPLAERWLARADRALLGVFGVELFLRVATYRPPELDLLALPPLRKVRLALWGRVRFLLTPLMLIDLLTVLALVPAMRGLRALRLLRLLRSAPIFQYSNPFQGLVYAFDRDRVLFVFAFSFLGSQAALGGVTLFLLERGVNPEVQTIGDGLWWAVVTLTTVGFGDITPSTVMGRMIGGGLMVGGMFTLALFAGIVGHTILHAVLSIREEQFRMSGYVSHIVVCGYEPGGFMLLEAMQTELDLDKNRAVLFGPGERPRELPPEFLWVRGDPSKESELDKVRLTHADTVVIIGPRSMSPQAADAATILTAFTIRSYMEKKDDSNKRKKPLHVVAEILDSENVAHVRSAGADEVIESRRVGYSMLAHAIAYPGIADATSRVVLSGSQNLYSGEVPSAIALPTTFAEIARELRERHGVLLVGMRPPDGSPDLLNPSDEAEVAPGWGVIYLAEEPLPPESSP